MTRWLTPKAWKTMALSFMQANIPPEEIRWEEDLFASKEINPIAKDHILFSMEFNDLIRTVLCHREQPYQLLYKLLWRQHRGESNLLRLKTDDDVHTVRMMEKSVRRDMHKMKAFVRFKKTIIDQTEVYVAWHEPDHYILRRMAPFFVNRFGSMPWIIITPFQRACWNLTKLTFVDGIHERPHLIDDYDELWKTYYSSIFNPARVKIKAMKNEMPVRYWKNLPEAGLIYDLIAQAQVRVKQFRQTSNQEKRTST